jgi:tetratricopeptide (TPR) repeat protein
MTIAPAESSAAEIENLEKRLRSNPLSPVFARLASLYLSANRAEEARELCEKGITRYPAYATAHLVLSKCYFQLARLSDAKRELSMTLNLQPRCEIARTVLRETMLRSAAEMGKETTVVDQGNQAGLEQAVGEAGVSTLLRGASIGAEEEFSTAGVSDEIVTPTLAEIYASQGAYREAIRTYLLLARRKPAEKKQFEQRIRELEEKWRALVAPS